MPIISLLGDLHFSCRDGNKTIRKHQREFLYDQFIPSCVKNEIDLVVQTGDFFDCRTAIKHQAIHDAIEFASELERNDIRLIVPVGNHDTVNKTDNDADAVTGILGRCENVSCVTHPTTFAELNMLIVPWICKENQDQVMQEIQKSKMKYLVGHFDILGAKFSKYGFASHDGLDPSLFKKFTRVLSGHFHTKSTIGNIDYVGTPYEMNWSDWNDDKGFHIFSTDSNRLQFVKNTSNLFYKIHQTDDEKTCTPENPEMDFNDKFVKLETSITDKKKIKAALDEIQGASDLQTTMTSSEINGLVSDVKVSSVSTMIEDSVKSVRKDRSEGVRQILKSAMEKISANI